MCCSVKFWRSDRSMVRVQVNRFIWRLDYAGIAVLIVASFYPPVYYGFMCQPIARMFYLASTTLLGAHCNAFAFSRASSLLGSSLVGCLTCSLSISLSVEP